MNSTDHRDSIKRIEDFRFLTGRGRYTGDLSPAGLTHAVFVRSAQPSGTILAIDAAAARAAPEVIAVFTAADLDADGITDLAGDIAAPRDDGGKPVDTPKPLLCRDRIRCQGEPIAMIVAESAIAAEAAAELVTVDIVDAPFVVDAGDALAAGAPLVWESAADNIAFVKRMGEAGAVDAALRSASHVTRLDFSVTRVIAAAMEPRVSLGDCDDEGRLILHTSTQSPFAVRDRLANEVFRVDPSKVRVVAGDVGGSFGMKGGLFREDALVVWAARRVGRPVRWVSQRGEAFLSDDHGRDARGTAELALNARGEFLALRVRFQADIGCYFSRRSLGLLNNIGGIAGVYRTPLIAAEITGIFTNTAPTAPYRGFGRPEATYVIERLADLAAQELEIGPFELRRRNLVPKTAMPFQTGLVFKYDSGDFAAVMARATDLADIEGFADRQRESQARGRLRGLGIANPIEVAGGPLRQPRKDHAWVGVTPDGNVEIRPGAMSVGQGHETGLALMATRKLGIASDRVAFRQGDTDLLPGGRGSGGSSALVVGGSALFNALGALVERGRAIAAEAFEVTPADVAFADGKFTVAGTDLSLPLAAAAERAGGELSASGEFLPPAVTYPNGCHVCEVEIDPDTGLVDVVRYAAVEDVGVVMNRTLVEGQMHGGIAQGIGQALGEAIVYDRDSGQLVSGSFMDYRMPIAADIPRLILDTLEVPTLANPLGVKGVGEAGTVGALAATMNAICNALAPLGVRHLDMPASPERVWRAIRDASA